MDNLPTQRSTTGRAFRLDTIKGMASSEGLERKQSRQEQLRWQFVQLRKSVHESMKAEEETRLRENPRPTEQELYMGAFREWLEPQVRDAMFEMFRKGYATQSSGFHGTKCQHQTVDGYFTIDDQTKSVLKAMGVEVLGGADFGAPLNTHICILRFTGAEPSVEALKKQWDTIAAALPENKLPEGIRPITDRAEEFRVEFAPEHPSLDKARSAYFEFVNSPAYWG